MRTDNVDCRPSARDDHTVLFVRLARSDWQRTSCRWCDCRYRMVFWCLSYSHQSPVKTTLVQYIYICEREIERAYMYVCGHEREREKQGSIVLIYWLEMNNVQYRSITNLFVFLLLCSLLFFYPSWSFMWLLHIAFTSPVIVIIIWSRCRMHVKIDISEARQKFTNMIPDLQCFPINNIGEVKLHFL